jgi:hypothetical protein
MNEGNTSGGERTIGFFKLQCWINPRFATFSGRFRYTNVDCLRSQNVLFLPCEILRHLKTYPLTCRCARLISGEEMGHKVNYKMQRSLATLRQHSLCVSRSIPLLRLIWFGSKLKIVMHLKIKTFIMEIKLLYNSCNLLKNKRKKNYGFQAYSTVNYCQSSCKLIIIPWKLHIVV